MTRAVRCSGGNESFVREGSRESEKSREETVILATLEYFDCRRKQTWKDVGSRESFLVVFNMGEEVDLCANGINPVERKLGTFEGREFLEP